MKKLLILSIALIIIIPLYSYGADTKITGLTEDTAPTSDDLIVTVNAPGTSPANRKVSIANLFGIKIGTVTNTYICVGDASGVIQCTVAPSTYQTALANPLVAGTMSTGYYCTKNATSNTIDCNSQYTTASALSAQYIDWNQSSGATSIANKPTLGTMAAETATNYVAKALYDAYGMVYSDSDNTPAFLSMGASTMPCRKSSGGVVACSAADVLSLIGGQASDADLTTLATPTAWRIFYSNGSQAITELALGADGTFLKSNGAAAAPTFDTPTGSGDITGVWGDDSGDVSALTAASGDTFDASLADSSNPFKTGNTVGLPGTCTAGQTYHDTQAKVLYLCTAANTWSSVYAVGADGSYRIVMSNNTAISPTGSAYEIYFDAGVLKWNENGTERTPVRTADLGTGVGTALAGALDTDLSSVSGSDDTLPSAKATKAMGDLKAALAGDNSFTGANTIGDGGDDQRLVMRINATNERWSGSTLYFAQCAASLAFGTPVYIQSTGKPAAADADAAATMPAIGLIVVASTNADTPCTVLTHGTITDTDWNFTTVGATIYTSETAGSVELDVANISDTNDVVQVLGIALHADTLFVSPSLVTIVLE